MNYAAANRNAGIFGEKMSVSWKNRSWLSHDLDFWNLVITTKGTCLLRNRFGEYRMQPGDVLLSPPSKERWFSVDGSWSCFWFAFNLHIHINWKEPVREIFIVQPDGATQRRILNDADEAVTLLAGQTGSAFPLAEMLIESILLRGNTDTFVKANPQLEAARNFIASNLQPGSFDHVARQFGMSRAKFFRDFRNAYGMTPQKYQERIKLQNVCSMLANTEYTLSEIAERCGFSSLFYLSRRFHTVLGVTMSSYRAGGRVN